MSKVGIPISHSPILQTLIQKYTTCLSSVTPLYIIFTNFGLMIKASIW